MRVLQCGQVEKDKGVFVVSQIWRNFIGEIDQDVRMRGLKEGLGC